MTNCPETKIAGLANRFRRLVHSGLYPSLHQFGLWIANATAPKQCFAPQFASQGCADSPAPKIAEDISCEASLVASESISDEMMHEQVEVQSRLENHARLENHVSEAALNEAIAELDSVHAKRAAREIEIGAVCNVLEVLERQLHEVNSDVESSVTGVCLGFQGMAHRAQAAIKAAESAVESSSSSGDGDLVSKMRTAVSTLVQSIQKSSEFSQSLSEKLDKLETRLTAVQKTLKDVEALANKAKLVALNGQIEASRLGAAGAAVAVVARETKNLSTHAATTSDSIRVLVSELAKELKSTSMEIRVRTKSDAARFEDAELLAQNLLNDIDVNNRLMMHSLGVTGKMGNELRSDIAKAVMSMQFQDRVNQCIGHVIETIDTMINRVGQDAPDDIRDAAQERSREWLREFASRCTMESERAALGQNELATCSSDCDVELF